MVYLFSNARYRMNLHICCVSLRPTVWSRHDSHQCNVEASKCMQGNCRSDPSSLNLSALDLLPLKAGQCVVLTDGSFGEVEHSLWLDNLYIRYHQTSRGVSIALLSCSGKYCNLWLTSVTLQGALGQYPVSGGALVDGGQLYAEGTDSVHSLFMSRIPDSFHCLRMDEIVNCTF
jgi:hypothetical protein